MKTPPGSSGRYNLRSREGEDEGEEPLSGPGDDRPHNYMLDRILDNSDGDSNAAPSSRSRLTTPAGTRSSRRLRPKASRPSSADAAPHGQIGERIVPGAPMGPSSGTVGTGCLARKLDDDKARKGVEASQNPLEPGCAKPSSSRGRSRTRSTVDENPKVAGSTGTGSEAITQDDGLKPSTSSAVARLRGRPRKTRGSSQPVFGGGSRSQSGGGEEDSQGTASRFGNAEISGSKEQVVECAVGEKLSSPAVEPNVQAMSFRRRNVLASPPPLKRATGESVPPGPTPSGASEGSVARRGRGRPRRDVASGQKAPRRSSTRSKNPSDAAAGNASTSVLESTPVVKLSVEKRLREYPEIGEFDGSQDRNEGALDRRVCDVPALTATASSRASKRRRRMPQPGASVGAVPLKKTGAVTTGLFPLLPGDSSGPDAVHSDAVSAPLAAKNSSEREEGSGEDSVAPSQEGKLDGAGRSIILQTGTGVPALDDLASWKLKQLKQECRSRSLAVTGKKVELAERLRQHVISCAVNAQNEIEGGKPDRSSPSRDNDDQSEVNRADKIADMQPPSREPGFIDGHVADNAESGEYQIASRSKKPAILAFQGRAGAEGSAASGRSGSQENSLSLGSRAVEPPSAQRGADTVPQPLHMGKEELEYAAVDVKPACESVSSPCGPRGSGSRDPDGFHAAQPPVGTQRRHDENAAGDFKVSDTPSRHSTKTDDAVLEERGENEGGDEEARAAAAVAVTTAVLHRVPVVAGERDDTSLVPDPEPPSTADRNVSSIADGRTDEVALEPSAAMDSACVGSSGSNSKCASGQMSEPTSEIQKGVCDADAQAEGGTLSGEQVDLSRKPLHHPAGGGVGAFRADVSGGHAKGEGASADAKPGASFGADLAGAQSLGQGEEVRSPCAPLVDRDGDCAGSNGDDGQTHNPGHVAVSKKEGPTRATEGKSYGHCVASAGAPVKPPGALSCDSAAEGDGIASVPEEANVTGELPPYESDKNGSGDRSTVELTDKGGVVTNEDAVVVDDANREKTEHSLPSRRENSMALAEAVEALEGSEPRLHEEGLGEELQANPSNWTPAFEVLARPERCVDSSVPPGKATPQPVSRGLNGAGDRNAAIKMVCDETDCTGTADAAIGRESPGPRNTVSSVGVAGSATYDGPPASGGSGTDGTGSQNRRAAAKSIAEALVEEEGCKASSADHGNTYRALPSGHIVVGISEAEGKGAGEDEGAGKCEGDGQIAAQDQLEGQSEDYVKADAETIKEVSTGAVTNVPLSLPPSLAPHVAHHEAKAGSNSGKPGLSMVLSRADDQAVPGSVGPEEETMGGRSPVKNGDAGKANAVPIGREPDPMATVEPICGVSGAVAASSESNDGIASEAPAAGDIGTADAGVGVVKALEDERCISPPEMDSSVGRHQVYQVDDAISNPPKNSLRSAYGDGGIQRKERNGNETVEFTRATEGDGVTIGEGDPVSHGGHGDDIVKESVIYHRDGRNPDENLDEQCDDNSSLDAEDRNENANGNADVEVLTVGGGDRDRKSDDDAGVPILSDKAGSRQDVGLSDDGDRDGAGGDCVVNNRDGSGPDNENAGDSFLDAEDRNENAKDVADAAVIAIDDGDRAQISNVDVDLSVLVDKAGSSQGLDHSDDRDRREDGTGERDDDTSQSPSLESRRSNEVGVSIAMNTDGSRPVPNSDDDRDLGESSEGDQQDEDCEEVSEPSLVRPVEFSGTKLAAKQPRKTVPRHSVRPKSSSSRSGDVSDEDLHDVIDNGTGDGIVVVGDEVDVGGNGRVDSAQGSVDGGEVDETGSNGRSFAENVNSRTPSESESGQGSDGSSSGLRFSDPSERDGVAPGEAGGSLSTGSHGELYAGTVVPNRNEVGQFNVEDEVNAGEEADDEAGNIEDEDDPTGNEGSDGDVNVKSQRMEGIEAPSGHECGKIPSSSAGDCPGGDSIEDRGKDGAHGQVHFNRDGGIGSTGRGTGAALHVGTFGIPGESSRQEAHHGDVTRASDGTNSVSAGGPSSPPPTVLQGHDAPPGRVSHVALPNISNPLFPSSLPVSNRQQDVTLSAMQSQTSRPVVFPNPPPPSPAPASLAQLRRPTILGSHASGPPLVKDTLPAIRNRSEDQGRSFPEAGVVEKACAAAEALAKLVDEPGQDSSSHQGVETIHRSLQEPEVAVARRPNGDLIDHQVGGVDDESPRGNEDPQASSPQNFSLTHLPTPTATIAALQSGTQKNLYGRKTDEKSSVTKPSLLARLERLEQMAQVARAPPSRSPRQSRREYVGRARLWSEVEAETGGEEPAQTVQMRAEGCWNVSLLSQQSFKRAQNLAREVQSWKSGSQKYLVSGGKKGSQPSSSHGSLPGMSTGCLPRIGVDRLGQAEALGSAGPGSSGKKRRRL